MTMSAYRLTVPHDCTAAITFYRDGLPTRTFSVRTSEDIRDRLDLLASRIDARMADSAYFSVRFGPARESVVVTAGRIAMKRRWWGVRRLVFVLTEGNLV